MNCNCSSAIFRSRRYTGLRSVHAPSAHEEVLHGAAPCLFDRCGDSYRVAGENSRFAPRKLPPVASLNDSSALRRFHREKLLLTSRAPNRLIPSQFAPSNDMPLRSACSHADRAPTAKARNKMKIAPPTVAARLPLECESGSAVAFPESHLCCSIKGRGLQSRGFETTSHTMKHVIAFRYLGEMLACSTSEFH